MPETQSNIDPEQSHQALLKAAAAGKSEVVRLLLDRGYDCGVVNTTTLDTPLHIAARAPYPDTCEHLLAFGADPNATNAAKETPLAVNRI